MVKVIRKRTKRGGAQSRRSHVPPRRTGPRVLAHRVPKTNRTYDFGGLAHSLSNSNRAYDFGGLVHSLPNSNRAYDLGALSLALTGVPTTKHPTGAHAKHGSASCSSNSPRPKRTPMPARHAPQHRAVERLQKNLSIPNDGAIYRQRRAPVSRKSQLGTARGPVFRVNERRN